jgi:hypothetical protein
MCIYDIVLISSQNEKCYRKNQSTHFMFHNFSENRSISEIMRDKTVQPDRSQMATLCSTEKMHEHRHTLITFNAYRFSTATMVTRMHLNVMLCYVMLCYVIHTLPVLSLKC